jgi:methylphosphotriester-DNA--protein-cysteine methyltransferase
MRSPLGHAGNELTRAFAADARRFPRRVSLKSRPHGWSYATVDYAQRSVEYVLAGSLVLRERGCETRAGPGMCVLTFRSCAYELAAAHQGCEAITVHNASMRAEPVNPTCVVLPRHEGLARLAEDVRSACASQGRFQLDATLAAGDHLAARAYQLAEPSLARPQAATADWLAIAQRLIDAQADSDRPLQGILGGIPLPYPRLLRLLGRRLGMGARAYRSARRVAIAKEVLLASKDGVTAVAHQLGYSSSQHFATEFRRVAGMSPSDFRARAVRG